jgi:hypothetical protein
MITYVRAQVRAYSHMNGYTYMYIIVFNFNCTLYIAACGPRPSHPAHPRDVPWEPIFTRRVHMMAAAEGGILHQSNPRYTAAIADATQGIPLTDGTLVYDQTCGLDVVMRGGHIAKP